MRWIPKVGEMHSRVVYSYGNERGSDWKIKTIWYIIILGWESHGLAAPSQLGCTSWSRCVRGKYCCSCARLLHRWIGLYVYFDKWLIVFNGNLCCCNNNCHQIRVRLCIYSSSIFCISARFFSCCENGGRTNLKLRSSYKYHCPNKAFRKGNPESQMFV